MLFSIYTLIAYVIWITMFVVWMLGRISNKKTLRRPLWSKYVFTTLLLYLGYFFLFSPYFSRIWPYHITPQNKFLGIIGVLLCLLGAGFAIWARFTLGKNWSGIVATQKEGHKLIKSGPYNIVRHPIYLGFFISMLGFALAVGTIVAYMAVLLGLTALLLRIWIEEKLMNESFFDYREYSCKIKRLIPFVW